MEVRILDKLNRELELDLPHFDNLDEGVWRILPKVKPYSEDLYEMEYFLAKRWLEIRDDEHFHESVLHIFNEGGEYLVSIDGNIQKGAWRLLEQSNTFITELLGKSELYDLAFLNDDFFILAKHGNQERKGQRSFFVMGREGYVDGLTWIEVLDLWFDVYRSSSRFIILLVAAMAIVGGILGYSLL